MAWNTDVIGVAPRSTYRLAIDYDGTGYFVRGRRVADSSMEFNTEEETETDILGIIDTDVTNMAPRQSFPTVVTQEDGDFFLWLRDILRRRAFNELKGVRVLEIELYDGATGSYAATSWPESTIVPQNQGGPGDGGRLMYEYEVALGGDPVVGTVDTAQHGVAITFTPTP